MKLQQSLQEVPASAVLQAIEQEKNRRDPSLTDPKAKKAEELRRLDEVHNNERPANKSLDAAAMMIPEC